MPKYERVHVPLYPIIAVQVKIFCHLVGIYRYAFKQLVVCFRSSAGKMILMRTLDQTPEEGKHDGGGSFVLLQNKKLKWLVSMLRRTILMKLLYHDDVTVR